MKKSIFTNRQLTNYHTYRLPELGEYHISPSTPYKTIHTTELCGDGAYRMAFARIPRDLSPTKVAELGLQRYYEGGFDYHPDAGIGACGRLLITRRNLAPVTPETPESDRIWALENGAWVRIENFVERRTGQLTHRTKRILRDGTEVHFRTFDSYDCMLDNPTHSGTWFKRNGVWYEDAETALAHGPLPELASYHDSHIRNWRGNHSASVLSDPTIEWFVGWEVEKEDTTARTEARRKNNLLPRRWTSERDGSLDPDTGVEFVSPVYNLFDTATQHSDFEELSWAIDSRFTTKCGGHITISRRGLDSKQLLSKLFPFIPLFFSLYEGRLKNPNYSGVQSKDEIERGSRKAIFVKDDKCVEIRIPSAVRDTITLKWRLRLMRFIAKSIDSDKFLHYSEVADAIYSDTKLNKILGEMYSPDKLRRKQSLTYLFGSLLESDKATAFVDPDHQERLLLRMREAWLSVNESVRNAVEGKFSRSAVADKLNMGGN